MQEPVKENMQEAAKGKSKSSFTIIVASIIAVIVLAALGIVYGIFSRSYNANLDKLKTMVAEAQAMYTNGNTGSEALSDQVVHYVNVVNTVANDCDILKKLNDRYSLLPGRASEKSLGLADLRAKTEEIAPQLDVLKACIDDDASITSELSAILGRGVSAGEASEYSAISATNEVLAAKLAGISFEGKLEDGRAAMAASADKRTAVLKYLIDDAAINEEIAKLSADAETSPADLKTAYAALLDRNGALETEAKGVDLTGYGSGQVDISGMISARKDLINACIAYMGELEAFQPDVAAYCKSLDGAAAQDGKFSAKLASYMVWVTELKDLRAKLDAINAKEPYKGIAAKRAIETLGMTGAAKTLLGYEAALNAANGAVATSKDIEKKIDSLIGEKKMDLPDKISAIEALVKNNNAILASIGVEVPDDMKAGLESFNAACQERATFLNEFMGYVEDQQIAAGCAATAGAYAKQRSEDLANAAYWKGIEGDGGPTVKYYQQRAAEKSILIGEQNTLKTNANKNASAHKAAYDASRKKYAPLLDQ